MEDPLLWRDVHTPLIVYLRAQLQTLLRRSYIAAIERRSYVEGLNWAVSSDLSIRKRRHPAMRAGGVATVAEVDTPMVAEIEDLELHESYIVIRDVREMQGVVTLIEVVSPTNKRAGPGRESYLEKQREVLARSANLVEIDLLRGGRHVVALPAWAAGRETYYDYIVSINRAIGDRKRFEFYPCQLRERLPRIVVPLAEGDKDVPLDLQAGLARVYEAGVYEEQANYEKPCRPLLSCADNEWAEELLRAATSGQE